jgi:citronellol/citronellal dehydrogenase
MIATAAIEFLGGEEMMSRARTPEIMADAAHEILVKDPGGCTGNTFIDDEVMAEAGVTDLSGYAASPDGELMLDLFIEGWPEPT